MKKGVSQVDWIVSLALFLLYVAWFFVFVSPQININPNQDATINFLKNDFYDEFKWKLVRTPIFVESNYSGLIPIILTNTLSSEDIKFYDNTPVMMWDDNILFLANMSTQKAAYFLLEGGLFSKNYTYQGIDAKQNKLSIDNMTINFDDFFIRKVKYGNKNRIKDADFFFNDDPVSVQDESLIDKGFVAIYTADLGNINHSTYVFDENTAIYNKVDTTNDVSYKFRIEMDLDEYTSYFFDNNEFGDFSYNNVSQTYNYTHDKLTLYGTDFLTMFFDSNVSFNFTYYNNSIYATLEFEVSDNYDYKFVFHDMGNDIQEDLAHAEFGLSEDIEGIYLENITTNYSFLKEKWGFSNFYIQVYENSTGKISEPSYEIGNFDVGRRNVYAETENLKSLDDEGELKPISVNYRIW